MSSSKKIVLLFILTFNFLGFTGCALPELDKVQLIQGSKVGIVVKDFPSYFTHVHIGATVFDNFENDYPSNINFVEFVQNETQKIVSDKGFIPIVLQLDLDQRTELFAAYHISPWNGSLSITKSGENFLNEFKEQFDIDLLIVLESYNGTLALPPDNNVPVGSYGLLSKARGNSIRYKLYSFIDMKAFNTSPASLNGRGWYYDAPVLPSLNKPSDVYQLSSYDIENVKIKVKKRYLRFLKAAMESGLNTSSTPQVKGATIY